MHRSILPLQIILLLLLLLLLMVTLPLGQHHFILLIILCSMSAFHPRHEEYCKSVTHFMAYFDPKYLRNCLTDFWQN